MKKLMSLFLTFATIASLSSMSAYAAETNSLDYIQNYAGFTLSYEDSVDNTLLTSASTSVMCANYIYDAEGNRTRKIVGNEVIDYDYDDDGYLTEENRGVHHITYQYEEDEYYGKHIVGFTLDNVEYSFTLDDRSVVSIEDEYDTTVAKYEYQNGIVTVLGVNEAGQWQINEDSDFVGNINLIRYNSYYFDEETSWYYCGRYYDPVEKRFVDSCVDSESDDIMVLDITMDVERKALTLLQKPTHGVPIDYSSNWWSNLSEIELVARVIYGENTSYYNDQNAIGRCLLNRYHGNDGQSYPDTMTGIITAPYQFSSITSNSNNTYWARNPDTTSNGWANATYLACAIVLSNYDVSDYNEACGTVAYMGNHTQFVSYSYFMSHATNGSGCIKYNGNNLSSVIIPGVGSYTTLSALENAYRNGFSGESNIHFMYAS